MDIKIQAIHFEISDRLTDFINKKAERLVRRFPAITGVDTVLKVVKPESAMNKNVVLRITIPQLDEIVANKTADSFEEAYDQALEATERQLEKSKERK